jgi:hypothetical protein
LPRKPDVALNGGKCSPHFKLYRAKFTWQRLRERFKVIEDFNREAFAINVDFSMPTPPMMPKRGQALPRRGRPSMHRCENGHEHVS